MHRTLILIGLLMGSLCASAQTPQQWRDSVSVLMEQIRLHPNSIDLRLRKAEANINLMQWDYALEEYGRVLRMDSRDSLDILIALGTAKEGFDWQWCECCLTIGIRASLTEVVQIIGRCTRDCPGKTHAQFINLIPCPSATQDNVAMVVNDMLKAITVSLLMEQVMHFSLL